MYIYIYIYICSHENSYPPSYHHNAFGAIHAHVPKCISFHKAIVIVVITRRAHCFHDCIYITPILIL